MKEQIERDIEAKESEPKVSYKFLFLAHVTAKDAEVIGEEIKNADIYCPEYFAYSEEFKNFLDRLVCGDVSSDEIELHARLADFYEFYKGLFKILFGLKKTIIEFIDIPERHPIAGELRRALWGFDGALRECRDYRLNNTSIKELKDATDNLFEVDKDREKYIISQIKDNLPVIVKKYPQLKNKEKIDVLISIGAGHTPIYHQLKKEELEISRKFSASLFVYSKLSETMRRKQFSPEKQITDEEVTEIVVADTLYDFLSRFAESTPDLYLITSYILKQRQLSCKELKKFSKAGEGIIKYYQDLLPKNQEEFNQLLKKIKARYG